MDFRAIGKVEAVAATPAMVVPLQATEDGRVFVQWLDPKTNKLSLYVMKDRKGQKIDIDAIGGLANLNQRAYFPTDRSLDILADATETASGPADSFSRKARHLYLIHFDENNRYQGKVQIEGQPRVSQFASLSTGDFVVSGYDVAADQDSLTLYGSNGSRLRSIDQTMSVKERRAGDRQANPTLFVRAGQEIVAWRSGTANPLLLFNERGVYRELPLELPPGSVVANVVPSDEGLVLQTSEAGDVSQPKNLNQFSYYEVNVLSGSLTRKLLFNSKQVGTIACKYRGEFIAYHLSPDASLIEYRAAEK